ncbi:MAG: GWxTD domain-containing protein [bacterium]
MGTLLLAVGTALSGCAAAGDLAPGAEGGDFGPAGGIEVELEVAAFRDTEGAPLLRVRGSFPRSRLLFQRETEMGRDARWTASYRWRAVIRDRGGRQVGGGSYGGRVVLPPGYGREDPTARVRFSRAFRPPEGRWSVEVTVEDEGSIRTGRAAAEASAPPGAEGGPGLSDIELLEGGRRDGERVRIGAHLPPGTDLLGFRFETYGLEVEATARYGATGPSGERIDLGSRRVPAGRRGTVTDRVDITGMEPGSWTLTVRLESRAGPLESRKGFRVQRPLLETGRDGPASARQMTLYASGETVERFREGDEGARIAFVDSLWKSLDPTPTTERNEAKEEFVRRLRHAEERWGARGRVGWESDPGRVYVAYGAPDEELEERAVIAPRGPLDEPREVLRKRWVYRDPAAVFTFQLERDGEWVLRRDLSTGPPPGSGNE